MHLDICACLCHPVGNNPFNVLLFLTINFGMGGAITVATITLAILFRGMQKEHGQTAMVA